ncbi:MAG: thioredoxin family protein [Muribaculaceae bacterium]|nr:thioredoxin family protein [Muribaculaceae bacterium]MDE6809649.1 thioredoxin family protein [Muribaculaceae bacterium]
MKEYESVISSNPVVLVEFYATWCPHCRKMAPIVEQVKELLGDAVKVDQFDIDQFNDFADEAEVEGVPTFIVYRNGNEVWRHSGEIDGNVLYEKVQSFMNW